MATQIKAYGHVDPPNIRRATAYAVQPELMLDLWGPAPLGESLRITVYDETLFMHGPLRQHYVQVFSVFKGMGDQFVPAAVRDADGLISDGKNGLLLTFTASVVSRVPKRAAEKNLRWAFSTPANVKACRAAPLLVDVAFGLRDEHNDRAFHTTINLPRFSASNKRRLIVVVSDPATHAIVFSSYWQSGNLASHNQHAMSAAVDPKAVESGVGVTVGGSGEGSGAPRPGDLGKPSYDLTGMYEAFLQETDQPGANWPVLMIQMNQAGNAIAGWMAPPAAGFAHVHSEVPPVPKPLNAGQFGQFLGYFDHDAAQLHWGLTASSEDPRADLIGTDWGEPDKTNTAPMGKIGTLVPVDELYARLVLEDAGERVTLHLRQVEPVPRWSNATRRMMIQRTASDEPLAQTAVRGEQEQPLPLRVWTPVQDDMRPSGRLGSLIVEHESTTDRDTRRILRTRISNYLSALIDNDIYRSTITGYFTVLASSARFAINGIEKSVFDWLWKIAEDFLQDVLERNPSLAPLEVIGRQDRGFSDMGINPGRLFEYTIKFYSLGAEIPLRAISAGAYAVEAVISRKDMDNDGQLHEPLPGDAGSYWQEADRNKKRMYGFFGDVGVGLGLKGKVGGASNLLQEVTFRSVYRLSPRDFEAASFYVVTFAGPSVSSSLLSASAANSAVMVLTIQGTPERQLVGGVDEWISKPDPSKPNSQIIKKHKPFEFTLVSLTVGYGWLTEQKPTPSLAPTKDTPVKETLGDATRTFTSYFRKASATLEGRNRAALEEAIAIERAILVSGGGHGVAVGHASPEGPDNDSLSERRANAVVQVAKEALGGRLAFELAPLGRGHEAALMDGMIRPEDIAPGDVVSRREYLRQADSAFVQYRCVMLIVQGILLVRLNAPKVLPGAN